MAKKRIPNPHHEHARKHEAFVFAWSVIRIDHQFVVQYGFTGFHPKYLDFEDKSCSEALERIEPFLEAINSPRMIMTPQAAWWMSPFSAKSAHEGLLKLFNPPEALFGVQNFLASREFEALIRDARLELVRCLKHSPSKTPEADDDEGSAFKFKLSVALRAAHLVNGKLKNQKSLSQERIGEIIGKSQSEVSRDIGGFLGAGWMSDYKAALRDGDLSSIFRGFARGAGDVEAIDPDMGEVDLDDIDNITGGFELE